MVLLVSNIGKNQVLVKTFFGGDIYWNLPKDAAPQIRAGNREGHNEGVELLSSSPLWMETSSPSHR